MYLHRSGGTHLSGYRWLTAAALAGVIAATAPVLAGDEALYGPAAPPDSAFVRVFNATPNSVEQASVGTESFNDILSYESSEFVFLPAGNYTLTIGAVKQPITLNKNRFYTAVYDGRAVKVLDNERYSNRMKALIMVYNMVDGVELTLKTADGKTAVVDKVAPNAYGSREVNPVKTQLALYSGDQRVAAVKQVNFERGKVFSLFVTGSPQQPVPTWTVN
jgi:alginate O-acetyltransferase complex protein AlgF